MKFGTFSIINWDFLLHVNIEDIHLMFLCLLRLMIIIRYILLRICQMTSAIFLKIR